MLMFDLESEHWYLTKDNGEHLKIEAGDIVHVRGLSNVPGFEDWGEEFEVYEMFGDWYVVEPYENFDSGRILLRGMKLSDVDFYGLRIFR